MRNKLIPAAVAMALIGLSACGDDAPAASSPDSVAPPASVSEDSVPAATVTGSLTVADQSGDGTSLTVASAEIIGASGFVTVHSDLDGKPGPAVGYAAIADGVHSDVVVTFDAPVATGTYWPMLHVDAGTIGTYEFPGTDGPVKSGDAVVVKPLMLTVG